MAVLKGEMTSGRTRGRYSGYICSITVILVAIFSLLTWIEAKPSLAQGQSVILNPIPLSPGNRGYGMRMHPIHKTMRMHNGQDYPAPIGTNIPFQGSYQGCSYRGSAGNMAVVANACGVQQIFMHLNVCSPGKILTGNTGGSTGPHLHYEIKINQTHVDPLKAFGKDLCKEDVRTMLLNDAEANGKSSSAGSKKASDTPEPPGKGGPNITYVPPGGKDPGGKVNTGRGYYYIQQEDGRVSRILELGSNDYETPLLGPTTEDVVPTTTTNNPVAGCATDTWAAMVNQAVLQTRREVMHNARYVLKPDSVMAYSCFNESLKKAGEQLGPVFSESKHWVNKDIDIIGKQANITAELGETSLDGAIENAASYVFSTHARINFKHDMLGGILETNQGVTADDEDVGQDNLPCGTMNRVWQMAKCLNADDDPLFPRFEDLVENESDTRKYPAFLTCNNTGITQSMIDIARQKKVKNSKVETHFDIIAPKGGKCHPPVATGVTVLARKGSGIITQQIQYPDAVCITHGCSYKNSGSGAGECVRE